MAELAKIANVTQGITKRRIGGCDEWMDANVDDPLERGYETINEPDDKQNDYEVQLFPRAAVIFAGDQLVTLSNITGYVAWKDSEGIWRQIPVAGAGNYTVRAIGTGGNGGVKVIVADGSRGAYRPPDWD